MKKDSKEVRKARRQANGKSHADIRDVMSLTQWAKSLPEIPMEDAFAQGVVTHMCYSHDAHCKTLKTGNGFDCNCEPDISFHRQPQGS